MNAIPTSGLRARIATAFVLIPLAVAAILALPAAWLAGLFAAIVILAAWEWAELTGYRAPAARVGYLGVIAGALVASMWVPLVLLLAGAAFWWLAALVLLWSYPAVPRGRAAWSVIGVLVLVPPWAALNALAHADAEGRALLLALMVAIWAADTGAYFTGRQWGQRRLSGVSPGKTWEGVGGGVAAALVVALPVGLWLALPVPVLAGFVVLVGITVAVSIVGDLLESLLKRLADRKDSGALLPGHGGLLDRIDSVTAAAPLYALGLMVLSRGGL